jgi:hypothetical protein
MIKKQKQYIVQGLYRLSDDWLHVIQFNSEIEAKSHLERRIVYDEPHSPFKEYRVVKQTTKWKVVA